MFRRLGRPYIGVTGFMSRTEVQDVFKAVPGNPHHAFMVGVLASAKTLRGEKNKWPGRYPLVTDIKKIFVHDENVINLIHYATDHVETLEDELKELVEHGEHLLDGFQLNVQWPRPKHLRLFAGKLRMVLQIGKLAMDTVEHDPKKLIDMLKRYADVITDVLIDSSGGRGILFNDDEALVMVRSLREAFPRLFVGIAGGFSPHSIDRALPFFQEFGQMLNIDAEGGLRTWQQEDALDIERAKQYVKRAFELAERNRT